MEDYITFWDYILVPIYFGLILFLAAIFKHKYVAMYPEFKYFTWGIFLKLVGVIAFGLVYVYYYEGGDTVNYYDGTLAVANMFTHDFGVFWDIVFMNDLSHTSYLAFDINTGWPHTYMWRDTETFAVSRYAALFALVGFKSFWVTSMLTACFSYLGIWKLYRLFNIIYPGNSTAFNLSCGSN